MQLLRQLVRLHGADDLIIAIQDIEKDDNALSSTRNGRIAGRRRDRDVAATKA
jgi:hypothetical protein